jgi:hypothetical protein
LISSSRPITPGSIDGSQKNIAARTPGTVVR